jgi:hypothetical protein
LVIFIISGKSKLRNFTSATQKNLSEAKPLPSANFQPSPSPKTLPAWLLVRRTACTALLYDPGRATLLLGAPYGLYGLLARNQKWLVCLLGAEIGWLSRNGGRTASSPLAEAALMLKLLSLCSCSLHQVE